jgi:cytochrome c556
MRTPFPLFTISALLFVFGVGFVVVGARAARQVPAAPAAAATIAPVATVKQVMKGIVAPAANTVFNAVSTTVSEKGVEDVAPHTDEEWETVGNSAAALAEAGNLMMMDGRAIDKGDWVKMSQAMIDAGRQTLKAVAAKDAEGVLAAGEPLNASCDNCHQRYMRQ